MNIKQRAYLFSFIIIAFALNGVSQTKADLEKKLLGKRKFGVQFIWDKYGSADVTKKDGVIKISGSQYSNDKSEYALLDGEIEIVDANTFKVKGELKLFTKDCCGEIKQTGTYTFFCKNNRKFWRLQEFNTLCSQYTCAYYLDIFK